MDNRGIESDPGWVNRRFQDLERKIEALRSERRAASTTIADGDLRLAGGGSLVVDGGDVVMLDDDGSVMFRLGAQTHGDRGFALSREDGTLALTVSEVFAGGLQTLRMFDSGGNEILSQEALGSGLGRPCLHVPMQPVLAASGAVNAGPHGFEVVTSSTSYTKLFCTQFPRQNQSMTIRVRVAASDTTTSGEIRVADSLGNHLGQFLAGPFTATRAVGTTGYVEVSLPGLILPGAFMESISLGVEVRRTAGAGSLTVAVVESRGG